MLNGYHTSSGLDALNVQFENASIREIISWVNQSFETEKIGFGTGFGSSGSVILDHLVQVNRDIPVFYIDTDVLFQETYELRKQLENRYDIQIIRYHSGLSIDEQGKQFGDRLWESNPDKCCNIRKVQPLKDALANYDVWITGIRRDQSITRSNAPIVEWEPRFNVLKVNPLATWTHDQVWDYLRENNIPYNDLYNRDYGSIGCFHCTSPLSAKESERAGRWRGLQKTECGLHFVEANDSTILQRSSEE